MNSANLRDKAGMAKHVGVWGCRVSTSKALWSGGFFFGLFPPQQQQQQQHSGKVHSTHPRPKHSPSYWRETPRLNRMAVHPIRCCRRVVLCGGAGQPADRPSRRGTIVDNMGFFLYTSRRQSARPTIAERAAATCSNAVGRRGGERLSNSSVPAPSSCSSSCPRSEVEEAHGGNSGSGSGPKCKSCPLHECLFSRPHTSSNPTQPALWSPLGKCEPSASSEPSAQVTHRPPLSMARLHLDLDPTE